MAVVGACALDSNGPPIIMPTKIASAESDVKRNLDLRNVVLMSLPFIKNKFLDCYGQRLFTVYPAAAPSSTAVPLLFLGTETLTVAVALLPNESVTLNVIV